MRLRRSWSVQSSERGIIVNSDGPNGERPLPYSEEAEMGVICSLIHEPALADEIRSQVGTGYFFNPVHQHLYEAVLKLVAGGKVATTGPVNLNLLARQLKDAGQFEEIGGEPGLDRIATIFPSAADWRGHIQDVHEQFARREVI